MTEPWRLPADLEVGVANSSWQAEGDSAGRGRCIWDDFAEQPGAIVDGSTGDPAALGVERLEEDLDLLAWLGVDSYRFSISWPRVIPSGTGPVSEAGMDFYDRMIDGLLARGITPTATLYHWDLPSELQAQGGWPQRDTAARFADYAGVVAARFGDRVARWATLNEPWCAAFLGHASGVHAPGQREPAAAFASAHHLLLGHAWAMEQVRGSSRGPIGVVLNLMPAWPDGEGAEGAAEHVDDVQNGLFLHPLAGRGVPSQLVERTAGVTDWAFVRDGDAATISTPMDWLGVNYYTVARVRAGVGPKGAGDREAAAYPGGPPLHIVHPQPRTFIGWEIAPSGLVEVLRTAADVLPGVPIYVTENGAAYDDVVEGTAIHDRARIEYIQAHLHAIDQARRDGVPVAGYFAWSFTDNIEWAVGWTKRFGLVRVDPDDPRRIPKDSAHWLRAALQARNEASVG